MKLLIVASTIDLKYKLGCTPAWWQFLKALHETGNEVILTTYLGEPIESPWWRAYPNPCSRESTIFNSYLERRKRAGTSPSRRNLLSPVFECIIKHYIRPKWAKHLLKILGKEKGIEALLFMSVPINHITGIPSVIKQATGIPIIYYDGDMPTILPKYTVGRGFKFNYYRGADLSEYDAFLTNCKGVIADLQELGAHNVHALYYAIDPELCSPIAVEKDIDISFFGYGSEFREEWIQKLITIPSRRMPQASFVVAGGGFRIDLGNAKMIGDLSYSEWRRLCCRSKINLNITRWSHTSVYASSTMRPFELAAFGSCIVSQPYNGIEEWFELGKELFVVRSEDETIETYQRLLRDRNEREQAGSRARERVLSEHTYKHRADELITIIQTLERYTG